MAKSTITLASGHEMPLVGFGLWKVPKETTADTVYNVSTPVPNPLSPSTYTDEI
jgi:diketogulonate reductase-like aldo/keto reductase